MTEPKTILEELENEAKALNEKIAIDEAEIEQLRNKIYWNRKRLATNKRQVESIKSGKQTEE